MALMDKLNKINPIYKKKQAEQERQAAVERTQSIAEQRRKHGIKAAAGLFGAPIGAAAGGVVGGLAGAGLGALAGRGKGASLGAAMGLHTGALAGGIGSTVYGGKNLYDALKSDDKYKLPNKPKKQAKFNSYYYLVDF